MTEPSRQVSSPRLGRDGRPVKPSSISTAVVLGFVQVGLSVVATVGMIVLVLALASAMEVGTGDEVWLIAVVQFIVAALLLAGSFRLRSGTTRSLYIVAVGLQLVICLGWLVLFLAWAANPMRFAVVPLTFGALAVIGVVHAARPSSSEYLRIMRDW
jgi:hypothetical protein